MSPDIDKIKELVLLIARRSEGDRRFGSTKLNKILFWADAQAYRLNNTTITGARYRKQPYGPAMTALIPALRQLEQEGRCHEEAVDYHGKTQRRVIADDDPEPHRFEQWELRLVEDAIQELWEHDAKSVSGWSHEFPAYELTPDDEYIPMRRMLLRKVRPLTRDEVEFGKRVFAEAGFSRQESS